MGLQNYPKRADVSYSRSPRATAWTALDPFTETKGFTRKRYTPPCFLPDRSCGRGIDPETSLNECRDGGLRRFRIELLKTGLPFFWLDMEKLTALREGMPWSRYYFIFLT
ncbi:hypothetical protein LAY41_29495 [Argonema galeatum A003/A1]|nr:hypothetical protein [Argonema galeatum A003/A1]